MIARIFFDVPKSSLGEHKCFKTSISSWSLPIPNEDLGRLNNDVRVRFWSTFRGREYSTWDKMLIIENSFKNAHATLCLFFPNLRLGSMKFIPLGLQCSAPYGIAKVNAREHSHPFDHVGRSCGVYLCRCGECRQELSSRRCRVWSRCDRASAEKLWPDSPTQQSHRSAERVEWRHWVRTVWFQARLEPCVRRDTMPLGAPESRVVQVCCAGAGRSLIDHWNGEQRLKGFRCAVPSLWVLDLGKDSTMPTNHTPKVYSPNEDFETSKNIRLGAVKCPHCVVSHAPLCHFHALWHQYSEQQMAQFRPYDLTKQLAYVSTQMKCFPCMFQTLPELSTHS